jgi:AraC family transcriptional regulator
MSEIFSEVEIRKLPKMRVGSFIVISRYPEIQVVDYMHQWAKKQSSPALPDQRGFGFDYPVSDAQKKLGMRGYEFWLSIPEDWRESDYVVIKEIPEDEYAVLRITEPFADPFDSIPTGWKKLSAWVKNGYCKGKWSQTRYCLEEVIEKEGKTYMDIYIPID